MKLTRTPRQKSKPERREHPLSARFIGELTKVVSTNPNVSNAIFGLKEGLHLRGDYAIEITAAKLVPIEPPPPPPTTT